MKRIIAGRRAVQEALAGGARQLSIVYVDDGDRGALAVLSDAARRARIPVEAVASAALDRLAGGVRHQGVLAVAGGYPFSSLEEILATAETAPLIVALDQIQDPHNFGAIVRSAVAMGADGVITLKDRACPVTPVVVRASAGATELCRIARVTNLSRALQLLGKQGLQRVGLAADGAVELSELPYPAAGRVLVVGSEGSGMRRLVRQQCDALVRLNQPGPIDSLNASVAAGIALYASARRRAALA